MRSEAQEIGGEREGRSEGKGKRTVMNQLCAI